MRLLILWSLIIPFIIIPGHSLAQEICNNAIDDDGDGLIDLNDPDCDCPVIKPTSLIPNPSFEDYDCCPEERAQMHCAQTWIQASEATTDYIHQCGWTGWNDLPVPQPFPDGQGCIGFRNGRAGFGSNDPNWKEYAGACLLAPLRTGESYKFRFYVGFTNGVNSPAINVAIFGTSYCDFLPFGEGRPDFGCPANGPGWVELGKARVSGLHEWKEVEIDVVPNQDITAIAIGPDCITINSNVNLYYYFDNLILADQSAFEFDIRPTAHLCDEGTTLGIPHYDTLSYQWYKDGIALVGETQSQPSSLSDDGIYQVQIVGPLSGCRVSQPYVYTKPESWSEQNVTICPEDFYYFDNRNLGTGGVYYDTLKTDENCDSIIQLNLSVFEDPKDTIYAKIFPGEQYLLDYVRYYNPGTYETVLLSKDGCDSTVYLYLS
ncbi:MAG: gliding motility-associated C-terminal domain-containing protein, partial [Bacteroidetes bacterium]|nr:gliding motility-associated C-terminal domain-containing protein [Bacteroidota bacterium]